MSSYNNKTHEFINSKSITLFVLFVFSPATYATNGLNLIGFGYESSMMGGADIAVARDAFALNTNPAGLAQIESNRFDIELVSVDTGKTRHSDIFNDSKTTDNNPIYGLGLGFTHKIKNTPITWGMAILGQGGIGVKYNDINTPFGTKDDLSTELLIANAITGVAYKVSSALSIGASISLLHSQLDQNIFANTSFVGVNDFFGQKITDATSNAISAKIGLKYQASPKTTIGLAYTSASSMDFSGNQFEVDFTAIGLNKVNYSRFKITGQKRPQELGLGVAYQATKQTLYAIEINWIDWSSAVKQFHLTASEADNLAAPNSITFDINNNWRDQWVVSAGIAHKTLTGVMLRAGFNYARNPIPADTLSPLLSTTIEKHLTFGIGFKLVPDWHLNYGFQWSIKNTENAYNTSSPTGPVGIERPAAFSLFLALEYLW